MRCAPRGTVAAVVFLLVGLSVAGGGVLATTTGEGVISQQSDEYEPNDDFDSAAPISPPFDGGDLAVATGDTDYFAVELQGGDRLDVSVSTDDQESDVDLLVFDPSRDRIAGSVSPDADESVSLRAGRDGTHYVLVVGWSDAETTYSLSVAREEGEPPDNDEFEYNDGFSSASEIEVPFERSGLRLAGGDVDMFALDVPADRRLHVEATFTHDDADVDLRLYDSDRGLVATGFSTTDDESVSVPIADGGRYVIEVFSSAGGSTEYALSVSYGSAETGGATATSTRTSTLAEGPLTEDATGVTVPGFGVGAALVALVLFVSVLATRGSDRRPGS